MLSSRRFPAPWTVEDLDTCFVVRDHDGQQLAYIYYEEEPGRRSAAKLLSKHEESDTPDILNGGSVVRGDKRWQSSVNFL